MTRETKHRVAVAIQAVLWGVQYAAIVVHAAATALEEAEALEDLNGQGGVQTDFVPYDR
jgi:hypothetical protein